MNGNPSPTGRQVLEITQRLINIQSVSPATDNCAGMKERITRLIQHFRAALYPQIFGIGIRCSASSAIYVSFQLQSAAELLGRILDTVLPGEDNASKVSEFLDELPLIKEELETDIQAAYVGDPAAKTLEEIMLAYPAFEAISIYRLAHRFYTMGIPLIPRMMTEYAHQITGIDIHPGATIGRYFFIDHGTGVVVGETTTIGDNVKLYQGVTLGAKSFPTDENGNPVKGINRHPDIGNNVVIYSGATILGGNTSIGDDCVIGGNVWLTHSVEAGRTVLAAEERGQCKIL